MHYHQHEFIANYLQDAKSILILGDVAVNLPAPYNDSGLFASEFFRGKGYEVDVADDTYKESSFKSSKSYDLIIDFHHLCIVPKIEAYAIAKNLQKVSHSGTVFIHFSPMPNHFPGMERNSNLTEVFWGSLLSDDAILETKIVGAYHNNLTGQESYVAHEKMRRFPTKKVFLEKIKGF